MNPVISVVGFHDSGKTTVVEQLIRRLADGGYRVGTVKHSAHGFRIDEPGRDSWRHQTAGAAAVVIANGGTHALISQRAASLPELLQYFHHVDVVITEGYKSAGMPKLEVYSRQTRQTGESLLAVDDPTVFAVVAEEVEEVKRQLTSCSHPVTVFHREDYDAIADYVVERLVRPLREVVAVVLAGGHSSRMGRDKAFVKLQGETLIKRQLRRLGQLADDLVVVTKEPAKYINLDALYVTDSPLGEGPLAGLHAGLKAAGGRPCFVVAVDMPFVSLDLARYLLLLLSGLRSSSPPQVVVPAHGGKVQPLHAVYGPDCLGLIERIFTERPAPALQSLFDIARTQVLADQEVERFGQPEIMFFNINTPEELRAAELLSQGGVPGDAY